MLKIFFQNACKPNGIFMIWNEIDGTSESDEKWTDIISGMTIYNKEQLETLLKGAGFSEVKIFNDKNRWLCIAAHK